MTPAEWENWAWRQYWDAVYARLDQLAPNTPHKVWGDAEANPVTESGDVKTIESLAQEILKKTKR